MSEEKNLPESLTSALEEFGEAKWKEGYLYAATTVTSSKGQLEILVRQNAEMKQKIAHADRLLRYAQRTFGQDGQFDSWFDNKPVDNGGIGGVVYDELLQIYVRRQ